MKKVILYCFVMLSMFILAPQDPCQAQATSFRIAGASNTYLMGINDDLAAAGYYTNAQGTFGFVFDQNDTIHVAYPGAVNTFLYDINNSGDAVGAYNSGSNTTNIGFKYNIYTHVFTIITSWLSGYQQVIPYKINNVSDVTGSYHLTTNNWIFLMIGGSNFGSLHYNYKPTYGIGLNDYDAVAGFYIDGGQYHGVLRSTSGVYTSFDYPGAFKTRAHGINDSMKIVGEYNNTKGFVYNSTSPASFQQIVIPGVSEIHPYDINNHGYIAGYFRDADASMSGFILMDKFAGELHFTDNLDAEVLGVAADGVAGITFRVKRTYGNSAINSIRIELEEPNNDINNPIGKIGTSKADADTTFINVTNPSGTNEWDFYYVAPRAFTYQALGGFYREVRAKITLHNNATNTDFFCEKMIRIIRPPVLLIHGLFSEGAAFQNCADYLIATGKYSPETAFPVDYKPSNQVAFTRNSYVLPTNIRMGKVRCRKIGYEAKKFDVVAHSMGAILTRLYLQSYDYKDDLNRLITVNSPLSGSQGANVIVAAPPSVREKVGVNGQAVDDLCVTSDAIRQLLNGFDRNRNFIPSYAITSTVSSLAPAFTNTIMGAGMYICFRLFLPTTSLGLELAVPYIFNGPSDMVVAENSQYGGCSANLHINEEWHSGICSNENAKLAISNLLEEPAFSPVFSMTGFDPPILPWNGQKIQPDQALPITDSVHFIQPFAGTVKANGDTLNIQVSGTSGISRMMLYVRKSADSVFLLDTVTTNLNYNYVVPALSCGKVPIFVFALDQSGNLISDSTHIIVQPTAIPDSLFITSPADSLMLPIGLPGRIIVSCRYADGIARDISALPGVVYQLQTNKALSLGEGVFKGLQAGSENVTVSYSGLSVNLPVYVDNYYPRFDTINSFDTICSGSTYTFYGSVLDSAGTYYASFVNQYGNDSTMVLHLSFTNCNSAQASLSGVLSYDNAAATPMNLATIQLKQNGSLIQQDTTDAGGNFVFTNLENGNYQVSVSTNTPWGGVNSADALRIMQHFVGLNILTGLKKKAADLNATSTINSTDALVAMKRFVGIFTSFTLGDWVFDSEGDTITVDSNNTIAIKGLCYGDANGSYNPSLKTAASVFLSEEGSLSFTDATAVEVPVRTKSELTLSSASLVFDYNPESTEIMEIIPAALSSDETSTFFISHVSGGEIRIAWFSLSPLELKAGETLFTLVLQLNKTEESLFAVSPESVFTDESVQDITMAGITYPHLTSASSGFEFNCCTPNPLRELTEMTYVIPADGSLQLLLYDALGNTTELMPLTSVQPGMHSFSFNSGLYMPGGIRDGIYWLTATYDNGIKREVKTSKVVIIR